MITAVVFDTINVIAALVVFGILVFKLVFKADKFTWVESLGMGLIAAGAMMVIGPVTKKPSPFDDWAFTLMLLGQAVYFVGRLTRHRLTNHQQKKAALRRLQEKMR